MAILDFLWNATDVLIVGDTEVSGTGALRTQAKRVSRLTPLRRYKLLCADPKNGHLELERHFEAVNDYAALDMAEGWRHNRGAELWRAYRVVKHWEKV